MTKRGSTYLFEDKTLEVLARIVLIQESKSEAKMTRDVSHVSRIIATLNLLLIITHNSKKERI